MKRFNLVWFLVNITKELLHPKVVITPEFWNDTILTKYVVKVSNKIKLAIENYGLYQKCSWNTSGVGRNSYNYRLV